MLPGFKIVVAITDGLTSMSKTNYPNDSKINWGLYFVIKSNSLCYTHNAILIYFM